MAAVRHIVDRFRDKKIIVVGDVVIDTYIDGKVNRISPEAPVPVVDFGTYSHRLGGAANVALNLKALGAEPLICTVIGRDKEGRQFTALVEEAGLRTAGIVYADDRLTTVKTRVIGNQQQLVRIDREQLTDIPPEVAAELMESVKVFVEKEAVEAIVFQDYNKGVLTGSLIRELTAYAAERQLITTVDPKKNHFFDYKGVTLFKPNLKELAEGTGATIQAEDRASILAAVQLLHARSMPRYTLVTMSEHGVYIHSPQQDHLIAAHPRQIADVSGAGDTVISVATLCLTAHLDAKTTALLANLAGGLVCEQQGVVSVHKERFIEEVSKLLK